MNFVLVTVDSLRADEVGYTELDNEIPTPAIDKLAENGVRYEQAYANAPYTAASFPAILSGTYAWMYGGYERLAEGRPFIAEEFLKAGYTTAGFHSNPYLGTDFGYDRGFDYFFDGESSTGLLAKVRQYAYDNLEEDSVAYHLLRSAKSVVEKVSGEKLGLPYLPAEQLNACALNWLADADEPAFLWIHYMDVHNPYLPHGNTVSKHISRNRAVELHNLMIQSPEELDSGDVQDLKTLYRGEIQYIDDCVRELVAGVDDHLGLDDTVLAFLSDHGEGFGEYGYFSHAVNELRNDLVRIPFFIDAPDSENRTVNIPVSTVDLLPTLLEYADISTPKACVGNSLYDIATETAEEKFVFAQAGDRDDGVVMACDGSKKLIRDVETGEESVYEQEADEEVEASTDVDVTDLRTALDEHLEEVDEKRGEDTQEQQVSEDVERRLEQLGYAE